MLRDRYDLILSRMESFALQLEARIDEINGLPFGSITNLQLIEECNQYRSKTADFGNCINKFGNCINKLTAFFNSLPKEEKQNYPDFWTRQDELWDLSDQLWDVRDELYILVDQVQTAGESKIDYNAN